MLKKAALAVGVVFLLIGVLGFIPGITSDGKLLGLFAVDGLHNLVHILSGAAFLAASQRADWSRLAFKVMAVVYGLVTLLGFMTGEGEILGLIPTNGMDNLLHLLLTAAFVYFGFIAPADRDNNTTVRV